MIKENLIFKNELNDWLRKIVSTAVWAPVTVFVIHLISIFIFNVYEIFPGFDIIMHFFGGIAITYFFIYCVLYALEERLLGRPTFGLIFTLIFLLTCTTTIFWEFFEWILDPIIPIVLQSSLGDTLLDMFLGILGGISIIALKYKEIYSTSKECSRKLDI